MTATPSIHWTTLTIDCSDAKMMHLEVLVNDLDAAVRLVLECGGTEALHQPPDRDRTRLRIMHDPAGHPFCVFVHGE